MQGEELQVIDGDIVTDVKRLRAGGLRRATLEGEIKTLRATLEQVVADLGEREADRLKTGAVVSKLSDSIVRAMLAQQKLSAQDDGFTWLRAHFDRMLRELGFGEIEEG
ncbi:MAG TPA: hypothetical protein VJ183_07855 [Chloroflexia bacterium]|nr:hypothetical protein [Chloroflexia bacterium]